MQRARKTRAVSVSDTVCRCLSFLLVLTSHGSDTTGIFIFLDQQNLKTTVDPNTKCVVDYAPDRFVFYLEEMPEKVVALVSPS